MKLTNRLSSPFPFKTYPSDSQTPPAESAPKTPAPKTKPPAITQQNISTPKNPEPSRGKYFDEFSVGDSIDAEPREIKGEDIDAFTSMTGDTNRLHSDDNFARSQGFQGRIAHGALILSHALGMAWQTGILKDTTKAFREIQGWKFTNPVYPGDSLKMNVKVAGLKPFPRLKSGMVTFDVAMHNQRGEPVCHGALHLLMGMRPHEGE